MSWQYRQKLKKILAQERGYVLKSDAGKISVALVYPNLYAVGMSNLGFQKIYSTLNELEYVVCERVFLPSQEDVSSLKKTKSPLISLESQKQINKFNVVAFSITFEMDYLNVLEILNLSRIPLKTDQRTDKDPIILAGGICPTFNPEPIANFIDVAVIGEGEEAVKEIMGSFKENKCSYKEKELSDILKGIEGIYIPSEQNKNNGCAAHATNSHRQLKIKKRWLKNLDLYPTSTSIITDQTIFGDMFLVEVGKGCKMKCRFCEAGYICLPVRNYSKETILNEVQKGKTYKNKIGLVGSAICDHPEIENILKDLHQQKLTFSVSSLRLNQITPNILKYLFLGGCKTISVAPEAGSERLRKTINKQLTEKKLFDSIRMIAESGIQNLKLYYIIGFPGETGEDIEGIIREVKSIKHFFNEARVKKGSADFLLTISVNTFVPKPKTPFQREPMENIASLKTKLKILKAGFKNVKNIKLIYDLPKWAFIQALLSRGDRKIGDLLCKVIENNGDWFKAMRELNLNPEFYVYRKYDENETLPWDFIDSETHHFGLK